MDWIDNLGLRAKLMLNFAIGGGVLILAIVFCLLQIRHIGALSGEVNNNYLPSIQHLGQLSQDRLRYRVRSLEYLLPGTPEQRDKIAASLNVLNAEVQSGLEGYRKLVMSAQEQALLDEAVRHAKAYHTVVQEAIALTQSGREDEAQALRRGKWVESANALRDTLDAMIKLNREAAEQGSRRTNSAIGSAIYSGLGALVGGIVVALLGAFWIARRLSARLDEAVAFAGGIAEGNLAAPRPRTAGDEIGRLMDSMSHMQQALRGTVEQTRRSADSLVLTSRSLGDGVDRLERNASMQSAAASAIASSVEELTVSIAHVSDNTSDANRLARESDNRARDGRGTIDRLVGEINLVSEVVSSAASRIGSLEAESAKISSIVNVIKDIADQTNLLALNAAIEAARAGEAGRGFAVVADEVRKLSERTSQSTAEITQMVNAIQHSTQQVVSGIERGVGAVESSVEHARAAGDTIAELQDLARKVAELVADVDLALREQSAASSEVAKGVEEIAGQAEETSAATRDAAQSTQSLAQVADTLMASVGRFRT